MLRSYLLVAHTRIEVFLFFFFFLKTAPTGKINVAPCFTTKNRVGIGASDVDDYARSGERVSHGGQPAFSIRERMSLMLSNFHKRLPTSHDHMWLDISSWGRGALLIIELRYSKVTLFLRSRFDDIFDNRCKKMIDRSQTRADEIKSSITKMASRLIKLASDINRRSDRIMRDEIDTHVHNFPVMYRYKRFQPVSTRTCDRFELFEKILTIGHFDTRFQSIRPGRSEGEEGRAKITKITNGGQEAWNSLKLYGSRKMNYSGIVSSRFEERRRSFSSSS